MSDLVTFNIVYVGDRSDRIRETLNQSYNLTAVSSLQQAKEAIAYQTDCLLVDQQMVDDEVFDAITRDWPSLPVVLLSEHTNQQVLEKAFNRGCQDIVEWPDGEDAETRLQMCLDRLQNQSSADIAQTVLEIARQLISATPDELETKIEWGLRTLGMELGATECVLYRYDAPELEPLYEWYHPDTEITRERIQASEFPGFQTHIEKFEFVTVPEMDLARVDLPEDFTRGTESIDSIDLETQGQQYLPADADGLIAIPVVIDWELQGVLAIVRDGAAPWPAKIRRQLRSFGEVIGHVIRQEEQRRTLEEQNQRLERFASVVAHDLRNPLNVIEGYAEIIAETGDTEHVEDIRSAATRMEVMLDELLEVARTHEENIDPIPVDIAALATEAWKNVDTKSATLQVDDPGSVKGDPDRLRHIFENLFRNAIEHGGSDVTVRVVGTESGFAVEDDGPGIPEDQRSDVFEEGYSGAGGTGLGLAIVSSVVRAHDWDVTVTAGTDGGARFEFDT